jgi:hypothetical protein
MNVQETCLRCLIEDVEHNLEWFDKDTGRFLIGGGWTMLAVSQRGGKRP